MRTHQQRVRSERPDVDHRVLGTAGVLLERELVERLPGRLDPDGPQHHLQAAIDDRGGVGEGLGDRLDCELRVRITGSVGAAERSGESQAELFRVGAGLLRDVVRGGSAVVASQTFFEHLVEIVRYR